MNETMLPVGIGPFGESLIYEKVYRIDGGKVLHKGEDGLYYEEGGGIIEKYNRLSRERYDV